MSYLITGGTGFIGSHIARKLVERGEEVVLLDLAPDLKMVKGIAPAKFKAIIGDVTNIEDIRGPIRKFDVRRIIHLAYYFTEPSQRDPLKATIVNCKGTANVLEAARLSGIEKVVWASSNAVYGHPVHKAGGKGQVPLREGHPTSPSTLYGACKVYAEFLSGVYREHHGLDTVAIRVSGAYGWGMWKRRDSVVRFLFDLFEKGGRGESCRVSGGKVVFDWQYVKDLADAFILASTKRTDSGLFNTSGHRRTVAEAAALFRELVPNRSIRVLGGEDVGDGMEFPLLDANLIAKELAYRPRFDLREGIADYLADLRALG